MSRDGDRQRILESAQNRLVVSNIDSGREPGFWAPRCSARNGLQPARHFLCLFLAFQTQGRRKAPRASRSNPLTNLDAWTSLPSLSSAPEFFLPTQLLSYVWDLESERPAFTPSSSTLSRRFLVCKMGMPMPATQSCLGHSVKSYLQSAFLRWVSPLCQHHPPPQPPSVTTRGSPAEMRHHAVWQAQQSGHLHALSSLSLSRLYSQPKATQGRAWPGEKGVGELRHLDAESFEVTREEGRKEETESREVGWATPSHSKG